LRSLPKRRRPTATPDQKVKTPRGEEVADGGNLTLKEEGETRIGNEAAETEHGTATTVMIEETTATTETGNEVCKTIVTNQPIA
jgi:hypothetical protein